MAKKQDSDRTSSIKSIRRQIIHSAVLAAAALSVIVFACYAWFVNNQRVTASIGNILMRGNIYELAGKGDSRDDSGYGSFYDPQKTQFTFNRLLSGLFPLTDDTWQNLESTGSGDAVRWRLNNDSNIGNWRNGNGIYPDIEGNLEFYVIPKVSDAFTLTFTLELVPLNDNGTPNENDKLNDLLKGHLIFSLDETNGQWLSWDSNTFTLTFYGDVNQPQPVTLHWKWPNTLDEIYEDISKEKIYDQRANLFYTENQANFPEDQQISTYLESQQLEHLSTLYNNADTYIGMNLEYLEVKLSAQLSGT